jgi:hypothetical protein
LLGEPVGVLLGLSDKVGLSVILVGDNDDVGACVGTGLVEGDTLGNWVVGDSLGGDVIVGAGVNPKGSSVTVPLASMLTINPCSLRSCTATKYFTSKSEDDGGPKASP